MSARGERNRQDRPASLLAMAPDTEDRRHDDLPDDAVTRHALARSRRERKQNALLAVDPVSESQADRPGDAGAAGGRLASFVSRFRGDEGRDRLDMAGGSTPLAANDESGMPERAADRPALGRIVGLTLAGALVGASLAFAMPSSHVATAELLIDPAGDVRSNGQLSPDAAFALVDNQIRVLRSGTMLGAVADRLNLASDADFLGGGLFGDVAGIAAGEPARVDGRQRAIAALGEALEIERVAGSSAITVSARTADAAKSTLVVNTLADLYVAGSGTGQSGGQAAVERLDTLRAEVERAERAVETYKAQNELVDAQGRLISDEQILALGEQLSAARARTVELNARAASTREANVDSIVTGSLPEQFTSQTVSDLRDRYAGLKQQLDRVATRLGPRHPERLAAEAELDGARQELGGELRRVAGAVQTELKRAVQQEQELASELARMKVRQGQIGEELIRLRELERDAGTRRAAYEDALRGSSIAAAGVSANARILSRAEPSASASGRSLGAFSLAGALGGFLLGLGLSRRREDAPEESGSERNSTGNTRIASGNVADAESQGARKENEDMYLYPYMVGPAVAAAASGQPQPAPVQGYPHPAQPQPMAWQQMPQQPPMAPPAGYGVLQQAMPWPQVHPAQAYQPAFVDPWAHLRGYPQPQPYAPAAFAPPPVFVYQPVQPQPPMQQQAPQPEAYRQHRDERLPRDLDDRYEQDRFVDERTNLAIEEIRQSLREFREAIEDLADERFREDDRDRRYGT